MDEILPPHDGGCSRNFITWYHPEANPTSALLYFVVGFFLFSYVQRGKEKS